MIATYLRESTLLQDIGTQRSLLQKYAEENKLITTEFADDDFSGSLLFRERPESGKLLAEISQGRVEEVIVYEFSRLGRDHIDTDSTIRELLKLGIRVRSLKEGLAENTPVGRYVTGIHTLGAQFERERFRERSMDASQERLKNRPELWMGGTAPYGYRQAGHDKEAQLEFSTEPISPTIRMSEADVVRMIFEKIAAGDKLYATTMHLNNLGIPSAYADPMRALRRGGNDWARKPRPLMTNATWWAATIGKMIRNTTYRGEHPWGKFRVVGKKVVNRKADGKPRQQAILKRVPKDKWKIRPCPALVSKELWEQANAMLIRNRKVNRGHPKPEHEYLLRGLIRCPCGRAYIGVPVKQRDGTVRLYYRCGSSYMDRSVRVNRPRCTSPGIRGEVLDGAVWGKIRDEFLSRPPDEVVRRIEAGLSAPEDGIERELTALEERLRRKPEARARVLNLAGKGFFSEEEIRTELGRIEEAAAADEKRVGELRLRVGAVKERQILLDWAGRLIGELRDKLKGRALTFERKRQIVLALVEGIAVPAGGGVPEVTFRFDPSKCRLAGGRNSGLVAEKTDADLRIQVRRLRESF